MDIELRNHWYVAAEARELGRKPLAVRLLDEELVLFRDEAGRPAALRDRCSHRNAQLSPGQVRGGCIVCPYHGWAFNGRGECVAVPSLCAEDRIPPTSSVPAYQAREQDGYVWVFSGERDPSERAPFALPHRGEPGWGNAQFTALIKNSVDNVVENFIDCPHTGYVHGGLFRQPASHLAETVVSATTDSVTIVIDEEQEARSVLGRLLVGKSRVEHVDRFFLPSIVQVSYAFGPERQITGVQICTPVAPFLTKVFVYVTWRLGWLTPLIAPLVPVVGRVILNQDLAILENQGEQVRRHGAHFCSVPADTANNMINSLRRRAASRDGADDSADASTRERRVTFRL